MAARPARQAELKKWRKAWTAERTRLIRLLRTEGHSRMDAQAGNRLAAFERAGVFRLGGTIVGMVAFRLYEAELGICYRFDHLAQTGDRDIASFEA